MQPNADTHAYICQHRHYNHTHKSGPAQAHCYASAHFPTHTLQGMARLYPSERATLLQGNSAEQRPMKLNASRKQASRQASSLWAPLGGLPRSSRLCVTRSRGPAEVTLDISC